MPQLKFSLRVHLDTYEIPEIIRPNGILFHRWIPNGRADGLWLTSADEPWHLCVWCERRAKLQSGMLEWDRNGNEFDEMLMRRQAKLDGGTLCGELTLSNLSEDEFEALTRERIEIGVPFGPDVIENGGNPGCRC